jgi:hypothetical protein
MDAILGQVSISSARLIGRNTGGIMLLKESELRRVVDDAGLRVGLLDSGPSAKACSVASWS